MVRNWFKAQHNKTTTTTPWKLFDAKKKSTRERLNASNINYMSESLRVVGLAVDFCSSLETPTSDESWVRSDRATDRMNPFCVCWMHLLLKSKVKSRLCSNQDRSLKRVYEMRSKAFSEWSKAISFVWARVEWPIFLCFDQTALKSFFNSYYYCYLTIVNKLLRRFVSVVRPHTWQREDTHNFSIMLRHAKQLRAVKWDANFSYSHFQHELEERN